MTAKPDIVTQILEQMVEQYNGEVGKLKATLKISSPDTHEPNDLQFMLWHAMSTGLIPAPPGFDGPGRNGEVYPPELFPDPNGVMLYASPYEIDKQFWEGGDKDLRRWQGIVERNVA